jgi:glutathione-regulated potassium-efflux system ancillary protein KefC
MTTVWTLFTVWVGLALIASLLSVWLRVSTALTEICVGTAAQLILGTAFGASILGSDEPWIKFLAGIGAIMLTFLAGAELDPIVFKKKWKEATQLRRLAELGYLQRIDDPIAQVRALEAFLFDGLQWEQR